MGGMQELDDNVLLREYVERGSEEAFATLVTRHINKVYSVALRHTRNPNQAEEITQAVFVILARKSHLLRQSVILSGWLYQTARLTAVTFLRGEIRRARREQESYMQTILNESESNVWMQIAPLLDAAMAGLNENDRHAVVLRYFDGKSLKEIGTVLGGNEDKVRMRINRALEKLRRYFSKRGVTSTTETIAGTISANSVQAAPVALAKSVTAVAIAKGATASVSTLTLIKGALKVMAWTKTKAAIVTGAVILLTAGTTELIYNTHQKSSAPPSNILNQVGSGQADFPKTKWRFAGYADPESALESTFWAMNQGDVKMYLSSLAPDGSLAKEARGKTEKEIVSMTRQIVGGMTGYKIISKQFASADRIIVTFLPETGIGQTPNRPGRLVIVRVGNGWKVAG
jgi:RNA polymerase sigma factor (sigma-70 family)